MRNILILLLVFSLLSCVDKNSRPERDFTEVWHFKNEGTPKLISECVDSVIYLPLRLNQESMFRKIDKIVFKNGLMYIGDFRTRKVVICDMDGSVRFVLNRLGSGEGEYKEIASFAVTEHYIYVLDNYSRRVYMYDALTGKYSGRKELPVVAWDVEPLANDRFLLAFVPIREGKLSKEQENCMIFVTDSDFNIMEGLLPFDDDYSEPYAPPSCYFTTYNDSIYFTSYAFDGVTVFPRSHPENYSRIGIDFENKLSDKERFDAEKIARSNACYLGSTPFFCGNYVALDITEGEYGQTCLYDREDSTFYHNPSDDDADCFNALIPPVGNYGNCFVSVAPDDYETYKYLVDYGFKKASIEVEEYIKNGEWVLLFYTMK